MRTIHLFATIFIILSICSCDSNDEELQKLNLSELQDTWQLEEFINKDSGETSSLPDDYTASIRFDGSDCISISAPCNSGRGNLEQNGDIITAINISLTEAACPILDLEDLFINNLSGEFVMEGELLKIISSADTDLTFKKSDIAIMDQCSGESLFTLDDLESDEYYSSEIFDPAYDDFYGKWKIESITGGFSGGGYTADFDYFEARKIGIYGFIRNDSILEYGKINIEDQTEEELRITLTRDQDFDWTFFDSEKYIEFNGPDTLRWRSPCCDRFDYRYVREE